tara:strand:- start:1388 stop:1909 length:522 start_codon:yes stop_codon:yes gene_type:complete
MRDKMAKINVQVENDSTLPKTKKNRKPMSPEQRSAAAERLALAREKRLEENPPEYKTIHPDVLKLDDTDAWSHINVKKWIKIQKDLLTAERGAVRANIKGAIAKAASIQGYLRNLDYYLKHGIYLDLFWGEYQQHKCKVICLVMAYYPDGTPKRSIGVWYPDICCEWTKEMAE